MQDQQFISQSSKTNLKALATARLHGSNELTHYTAKHNSTTDRLSCLQLQTNIRDSGHEKFVWVLEINRIRQPERKSAQIILQGHHIQWT